MYYKFWAISLYPLGKLIDSLFHLDGRADHAFGPNLSIQRLAGSDGPVGRCFQGAGESQQELLH
jgi:hypothetical protein